MYLILIIVSLIVSLTSLLVSFYVFFKADKINDLSNKSASVDKKNKRTTISFHKNCFSKIKLIKFNDVFNRYNVEKGTGLLGSVFILFGILFITGYGIYKVTPLVRFISIVLCSFVLVYIWFRVKNISKINNIAFWIKTISGSLMLFAAVGSILLDGLKWTSSPFILYFVLLCGVSINLIITFCDNKTESVPVNVVLSIISFSLIPQSTLVYFTAFAVTILSLFFSFRRKMYYNLYILFNLFACYHIYIFLKSVPITDFESLSGRIIISLLFMPVYLIKYDKSISYNNILKNEMFNRIVSFILFIIAQHIISGSIISEIAVIFSVFVLLIYGICKKNCGIVSQFDYFASLILLCKLGLSVNNLKIISVEFLLLAYCIISLIYFQISKKIFLNISKIMISIYMSLLALSYSWLIITNRIMIKNKISIAIGFIIVLCCIEIINKFKLMPKLYVRLLEIINNIVPSFVLCLIIIVSDYSIYNAVISAFFILIIIFRSFSAENKINLYLILSVQFIFISKNFISYENGGNGIAAFVLSIPLVLVPLMSFCYLSNNNDIKAKAISISSFYLSIILLSLTVLLHVSPFIPSIVFLMISVLSVQYADLLLKTKEEIKRRTGEFILIWVFILDLIFLITNILININIERYIIWQYFKIKIRFLIEAFSVICLIYILLSKEKAQNRIIKQVFGLNLEILLLIILFTVKSEIFRFQHSIIWVLTAIVIVVFKKHLFGDFFRLRFYSILFFTASIIQNAFYLCFKISPDGKFYNQGWFLGSIAIILQFVYVILVEKDVFVVPARTDSIINVFRNIYLKIISNISRYLIVPMFLSSVFFIYNAFSEGIVAVLWILDGLSLYVLSSIRKIAFVKILSVVLMVISFFRILIVDSDKHNIFIKSLVLLFAGCVILLLKVLSKTGIRQKQ